MSIQTDRTEQRDLAAAEPERVRELAAKWNVWAGRCQVAPNGLPKRNH